MTGAALSRVLEKTMNLDESITNAFEAIREFASFDSHSLVPHPDNLRFQAMTETVAMLRLGTKLTEIVGDPDGEDLQYCAHTVRRYFWQELGLSQPPDLPTDVPRFLLKPGHTIENRIDAQELADKLAQVPMPEAPVLCIVASKLALLSKLLNMSDTGIHYLGLAFAHCSIHSLTIDESSSLKVALSHIGLADDAHRNRAVAVLLNAPLVDVQALFAAPSKLAALRFLDAAVFNQRRTLRDVFVLTDEFVALLETPYRSHKALLAGILEPEQDFDLLDDGTTPIGYLYEILPKDIAEAYECAVLDRPLKAIHIQALVSWYTAGFRMLPSFYSPLAGHITVEALRDAIKRVALECAQANKPLTSHALVKALYAAST
jgi:hypothetical protein